MHRYLTTKELADLLRLKERKVYDLAATGGIPCTRATGKLLFPRDGVEAWLQQNTEVGPLGIGLERRQVFLGSHDPLLEWALRESRTGLATFFDSSRDGLERFCAGEGIATGLHVLDIASGEWNVPFVRARLGLGAAVLIEWAVRQRGLILSPALGGKVTGLAGLRGYRFAPRQPEAGSQVVFEYLLGEAGIGLADIVLAQPARSEADAALAVLAADADATFGLEAHAVQYGLAFVPIVAERFDILVSRRAWFEPPLQTLMSFCRTDAFRAKAAGLKGYDIDGLGRVHFNGRAP
ncbi:MAG: helix-turn-helix transcriptional regulator [Hyphomicrobiaceae bacterium]|nr:helix-turn-helix transcriptional regulator [Hyphomicrobiaceae bacterium]